MDVRTEAVTGVIALDRHGREICSTAWDRARGRRWIAQDVETLREQLALREALPPWPYTLFDVAGDVAGHAPSGRMIPVRARTLTYRSELPATDLLGEQGDALAVLLRWIDRQPRHGVRLLAAGVPDVLLTRWSLNRIAASTGRGTVVRLAQALTQRAVGDELMPGLAALTAVTALLDHAPRELINEVTGAFGRGLVDELLGTGSVTAPQVLDELAALGLEANRAAEAALAAVQWPASATAGDVASAIESELRLRIDEFGGGELDPLGDEVVLGSDVHAAAMTLHATTMAATAGAGAVR